MEKIERGSLDPDNWEEFRRIAHLALDDALGFVEAVRERPVWLAVPEPIRERLKEPLPVDGTPLREVYDEFKSDILPFATGNIHPRFFGWVHGSGQVGNIVAETLAAAMNSNCGGRDHGAILVEREVIGWFRELFGFPDESSGLIVSGTSMATLVAIGVARNAIHSTVRTCGFDSGQERLVVYASEQAHESVVKSLQILGLGTSSLRKIAVNPDFSIDLSDLSRAITEDRAAGRRPFCCVGCAGTVNTGAIDDLQGMAEMCRSERIWFHVDGAFGALCMMSESLRHRLKGIERADSLAFDFHKWAHVQYDAACVLIRNGDLQRDAYSMHPPYLHHQSGGLGGGDDWPCDLGPELSRSFRALKIWFAFKQHGTRRLGQLIEQNCAQASYLAEKVEAEPGLELLAPVDLNIVCFRCLIPELDEAGLDSLNEDIVVELQVSGIAAPSTSRIKGKLAIRVNITNHRTQFSDIDVLVDAVLKARRDRASG